MAPFTPLAVSGRCDSGDSLFERLCRGIDDHDPTGTIGPVVSHGLSALIGLMVVLAGGRLLRRVVLRALSRSGADLQVRQLVGNVLTAITVVFALLVALTAGGVNLGVLITVSGLTSLAIGLAFQDLLRNVLAGIFLLIERPFRIGDTIAVGDVEGKVQSISLRTTLVRTLDGKLAVLPNLQAFNTTLVNVTAFEHRRFTAAVRMPRGADLPTALRLARAELARTEGPLPEPSPIVLPVLAPDGGITVECRYWLAYRTVDDDAIAASLMQRLQRALRSAGIGAVPVPVPAPEGPGGTREAAPPEPPEQAAAEGREERGEAGRPSVLERLRPARSRRRDDG